MFGGESPAGAVDHSDPAASSSLGGLDSNEPKPVIIGGVDIEDAMFVAKRKSQIFLDKISFYPGRRWACFTFFLLFFLMRMYIK